MDSISEEAHSRRRRYERVGEDAEGTHMEDKHIQRGEALTFSGQARPSGSPGPAVPLDIIYILPSNRFRIQARLNWTRPGLAPAANMWEVLAL